MNKSTLFGVACLLAATAMGNTSAAAAEKFDTDPKNQLPRPDGKPADMKKPVKVFILLGQSNMLGMGDVGPETKNGTLEYLTRKEGRYPHLLDEAGKWTVRSDVRYVFVMQNRGSMQTVRNEWLTVKGNTIGPELQFGHIMGHVFDEPVLVLKACIGNRSLGWDYLPPGSERYEFTTKDNKGAGKTSVYAGYKDRPDSWDMDKDKGTATAPPPWIDKKTGKVVEWYAGRQYDDDVANAKAVLADIGNYYPGAEKYEVAGFVWWQGHKDQGEPYASRYEQNLVRLIKSLRKDFNAPNAPFVLAVGCGNPGRTGFGLQIAEAQLAMNDARKHPEFAGNVKCVESRDFWREVDVSPANQGYHYNRNAETYMEVGNALGWAMAELGAKTVSALEEPALPARPVFRNGQAQVVKAFENPSGWVRESLWVETEFDSDGDGRRDRVFTDVTRPGQTETEALKVAVIYESSPYFAGTAEGKGLFWDVRQEVGEMPPARTDHTRVPYQSGRTNVSDGLVKTWVPRGFAVAHSDAPGTGLSDGCVTIGGPPEALAPKAVIDWLNGRARGFRTREGTEETRATRWCTGKVGMIGTSYNGTIPLAAATTGVKGLEAIIPVAPNTSYYHYYRSHGLVRHPGGWLGEDIDTLYDVVRSGEPARTEWGDAHIRDGVFARGRDRQSGDYNAFWAERDLLKKVRGVKAAVLMAHAFNDWNVMPEHSVRIATALKGRVPLRMYFHQGGHGGNPPMEMVNRWFSRFLYDIPNGVDKGPRAWIVRESDPGTAPGQSGHAPQLPTPYADYPNPQASVVTLRPGAGGGAMGPLGLRIKSGQGTETLVDDVEFAGAALAKAGASEHRLLYATPELLTPLHISGTARITLRLASSKPAANLSVWLVVLPWTDGPIGPANIITRGWADPQNHASLKRGGDYHSMKRGEPLIPGKFYRLTFDLQPDDQVIPAGKRMGLMIFSSDRDFTLWPKPGAELTLDLDGTSLRLPVVGGRNWFEEAVGNDDE